MPPTTSPNHAANLNYSMASKQFELFQHLIQMPQALLSKLLCRQGCLGHMVSADRGTGGVDTCTSASHRAGGGSVWVESCQVTGTYHKYGNLPSAEHLITPSSVSCCQTPAQFDSVAPHATRRLLVLVVQSTRRQHGQQPISSPFVARSYTSAH